jgi:hypothetical protein
MPDRARRNAAKKMHGDADFAVRDVETAARHGGFAGAGLAERIPKRRSE